MDIRLAPIKMYKLGTFLLHNDQVERNWKESSIALPDSAQRNYVAW